MSNVKSIMFVGVGGQGTLLASKLFGYVLLKHGFDVKVSEVHGMSQRGGSVVTYVRYGDKVFSPMVPMGGADIIVAFEQLEALRWISNLKLDGEIIINTQKIMPMPVVTGAAKYPENIIEDIKAKGAKVLAVDALELATKAGNKKAVNVVLIGVMAKKLGLDKQDFFEAIDELVAPKIRDMNKTAFSLGFDN